MTGDFFQVVSSKRLAAFANLFFSLGTLGFNIVSGLLMVPIYLRYMDSATYGAWLASYGIISLIGLCESGLSSVTTQRLAMAISRGDKKEFACLLGTSTIMSFLLSGVAILFGAVLVVYLPDWVGTPPEQMKVMRFALMLSVFGSAAIIIMHQFGAVSQAWQRTTFPGIVNLAALCAYVGVIIGLLYRGYGLVSLGAGQLVNGVFMAIGQFVVVVAQWWRLGFPTPCYSRATAGDLWRESRALLVARIAGAVGSNLEVPLAAMVASPAASTVLALTGKVMTLVMMMTERIGSAVFAGLAYISGKPSTQRDQVIGEIVNISTVLSGIGLAFALVFSKPIITLWVGPELFGGNWLVILIMVSCLMSIRMRLYSNFAMALGEIRRVAGWMIAEAMMRLALLVGLGLLLRVFGLPLANAIVSAIIMTILGQLLIHRLRVRSPVVWLPGWPSLTIAMSVALTWMLLIPVARTWTELTWQAGIFAALVLLLSVAVDSQWRAALRKNYYTLPWRLVRRSS